MRANEIGPIYRIPKSFYNMDGKKFLKNYLRDHKLQPPLMCPSLL